MHAASVHPEPGSNSRKFVSYHLSVLQSYFRAFVALLLLFELYFLLFELSRFYFALFVCFVLISKQILSAFVVQFSMTGCRLKFLSLPLLFAATRILYHIRSALSSTFSKVFCFFSRPFLQPRSLGSPRSNGLYIILPFLPLVNTFFKVF